MRRLLSIWFVLCMIAVLLVPLFASAAPTSPSYTYYSYGTYDGALWYNAYGAAAETSYESNNILPMAFQATDNSDLYLAQTFTPSTSHTLTKVSLKLYRTVPDPGVTTVSLWSTHGGAVPASHPNAILAGANLASNLLPYGAENATWIEVGLSYALVAGTQYAISIVTSGSGIANVNWGYNGASYPNGEVWESTDAGVTWGAYAAWDFCFIEYGAETNYSIAHQSSVGNIAQSIINTVGQSYSATTGQYIVSRGALFFNTEGILPTDNIQSATLQVWVESDHSTTDFDLTMVDGSGLNGPLQTSDYYELRLNTDNQGSVNTLGITTSGYTTIDLNATGLSRINKIGYTKIGLRSSLDIAGTAPTGNEYVDIYMGESVHPPILTITYLVGELGIPDEMKIGNVYVLSHFQQAGDEIFVWQNTLRYEETPRIPPTEYFVVQLLAADNSVIGQTVINEWGYAPLSIYLTDNTALAWKTECSLLLTGSSLYGTPAGFTPYRYEVQNADWRGLSGPLLDYWCKTTTSWIEEKDGVDPGTYSTTGTVGQWCFHPDYYAQSLFLEGIPYIGQARPNLFLSSDYVPATGTTISGAWAKGIYSTVWGTYWSSAFLKMASPWGLAGQWIIGIMFGGFIGAIGALIRQKTGDPNISLIVPVIIAATVGVMIGSYAMVIALIVTTVAVAAFLHNFILSRT